MKKIAFRIIKILVIAYIVTCGLLYFFQEKLIFVPDKLPDDYQFEFNQNFQEINIKTNDNLLLNGILFKADSSKGLIFYLHGNGSSIRNWGKIAKNYTDLKYDLFMLDYRGYGKSNGKISSQGQLFRDVQIAYDSLKSRYAENRIIVLGYSIGTGLAAKLASTNCPKMLILQAPYYSFKDLVEHIYPGIPIFLLRYNLETNKYLPDCKMPIVIFHGDQDEAIYYNSSVKLKKLLKQNDTLFILKGQRHNRMSDNPEYLRDLKEILSTDH
jgi:uncharacterized protein